MKTCQSTGYFQRVYIRSLLCFISSVVFAGSASAYDSVTNNINACYDCHGSPTIAAGGGTDIRPVDSAYRNITSGGFVGNHRTHMAAPTTNPVSCTPCHGPAPTKMDHRNGLINMRQHINSTASIRGYYNKPVGNPAVFFNQTSAPQLSTCNNVNCHFRTTTSPWGSATLTGGQTVANCAVCHLSTGMATGNHATHISLLGGTLTACSTCHPNNTTFTHATSAKTGGVLSVTLAGAPNGTGTYTAGTHITYPRYLDGSGTFGTCSATYCHSSGKQGQAGMVATIEPANPTWSGAVLDCKGCHGARPSGTGGVAFTSVAGEPNYTGGAAGSASANSHLKHVGAAGASTCANCHSKTTANGTTIIAGSQHLDKLINYTSGNGKTFGKLANKTCSNISCHSGGGLLSGVSNAQWGAALTCAGCHGDGVTGTLSAKHALHVNNAAVIGTNYGCADCHSKTVSSNTAISTPANHLNSFIDYSGAKAGRSSTYTGGTCSASYCHTSGKKGQAGMVATVEPANPSWTGAALDCKGCHGAQVTPTAGVAFNSQYGEPNYISGAAGSANANSHLKHVPTGAGAAVCARCHQKTTTTGTTIIAGSQHIDRLNNYTSNSGLGYTFGKVAGKTCSNINCHSGGGIVAGVANAQWGATLGCAGCHGDVSTLTSGAHGKHLALSGVTCNYCHNATTSDNTTVNTPANHLNSSITINLNASAAPAGGTYNGVTAGGASVYQKANGLPAGSCATSVCHGGNSAAWNVVDNNSTCTKCHGTPTVTVTAANRYVIAPPVNTAGTAGTITGTGQVSNNPKVGAHQAHLQFLNGFSNYSTVDYRCQSCHGTLPVSGAHANGSSAPAFQGLATRGGMTPAWTAATVTCSNTYCHNPAGSGILNAGNVGTRTFVSWTSSSYLADSAKNETNCNRCHKSPGTVAGSILLSGTSSHSTVKIADSCSGCHGHDGNTAGTVGKRHMDGIKYGGGGAGGCIGCHGYGVGSWAAASSINAEGKGAHEKHISYLTTKRFTVTLNATTDQYGSDTAGMGGTWTNVCGICHSGGAHMDSTVNVAIGTAYLFGTGSPTYSGTPGQSSASVPKTCSNISCHYFTTPLWSTY